MQTRKRLVRKTRKNRIGKRVSQRGGWFKGTPKGIPGYTPAGKAPIIKDSSASSASSASSGSPRSSISSGSSVQSTFKIPISMTNLAKMNNETIKQNYPHINNNNIKKLHIFRNELATNEKKNQE